MPSLPAAARREHARTREESAMVERVGEGRPKVSPGRRVTRRAFVRGSAAASLATGVVSMAGCAPTAGSSLAPTAAPAAAAPAAAATAAPAAPSVKLGVTFRAYSSSETPNLDPDLNGTSLHH